MSVLQLSVVDAIGACHINGADNSRVFHVVALRNVDHASFTIFEQINSILLKKLTFEDEFTMRVKQVFSSLIDNKKFILQCTLAQV